MAGHPGGAPEYICPRAAACGGAIARHQAGRRALARLLGIDVQQQRRCARSTQRTGVAPVKPEPSDSEESTDMTNATVSEDEKTDAAGGKTAADDGAPSATTATE